MYKLLMRTDLFGVGFFELQDASVFAVAPGDTRGVGSMQSAMHWGGVWLWRMYMTDGARSRLSKCAIEYKYESGL